MPSDDTFRRVIARLRPGRFEACFRRWIETLRPGATGQHISIDGKTLRGSYDRADMQSALHLVSAWAEESRLILAQRKVDDKTNEITAIPDLLEALDLEGAVVTIDAMGRQRQIARQIQEAGADYVLAPGEQPRVSLRGRAHVLRGSPSPGLPRH